MRRKHLSQQHPENKSNDHTDTPETQSVTESLIEPTEVAPTDDDQSLTLVMFVRDCSSSSSQSHYLFSQTKLCTNTFTAINFVVQEASTLVSDIIGNLQRKIVLVLLRLGQNETPEVQDLNCEFQRASVPFQGLKYFICLCSVFDRINEAT